MKRSVEACLRMTDAEVTDCLARGRAGHEEAILELFHYMYPHVAKLVQANLPAREPAEDLVQKVCVKVVTHLHQFSGKVPFLHWISRIAVNTCLNQIRHEKHRPELRLADLSEDESRVVENLASSNAELSSADRVAATDLVNKLLDGLKPEDRLLVRLMYLDGHALKEISGLTGWSAGSIKVRAFRARGLLRKRYALLMKENP
jgi:RNA polymerase sigma-70 factor (ECF subfamily)